MSENLRKLLDDLSIDPSTVDLSTVASSSVASSSEDPSTVASSSEASSTVASSSEDPSTVASSSENPSTVASSSEDPSTVRVKIQPNPLYIGVKLRSDEINTIILKKLLHKLVNGKTLKNEFHSTLVFRPSPSDIREFPENGTPCTVTITGVGSSPDAFAFEVSRIVTEKGDEVFHVLKEGGIPHITVALAPGVNPADSYLAIRHGTYTKFAEPITLNGNIEYYYPKYKDNSKKPK